MRPHSHHVSIYHSHVPWTKESLRKSLNERKKVEEENAANRIDIVRSKKKGYVNCRYPK